MNPEVIHLQNPDELALRNAYRTLPRTGEVSLYSLIINLAGTISTMESIGFIGMEIVYLNPSSESINIRAYKGKTGPCHDTGRVAMYQGAAFAALDDDNHLLLAHKETPVCEKTAKIYMLPAYSELIKCSDANPDLMARLSDVPEIFRCDSFEDDQEKLFQMVKDSQKAEVLTDLFYPGPFRLLILKDGRIIKRGQLTMVPESVARLLKKRDGLFKIENFKPVGPLFFQEIYASGGSRCLLDNSLNYFLPERERDTDLTRLEKISGELTDLLVKVIRHNKKYFILTGSDLRDKLGCCPSEVVTAANELKTAGILDSYHQPVPDETCPVTIYAFKNEISITGNDLQFNINTDFREKILNKLESKTNYQFSSFVKWILLSFIVISLTIALLKFFDSSSSSTELSLYEQLVPESKNQLMVLLFHYSERCEQCLIMEKYSTEVLKNDFPEWIADKRLQFQLIIMDQPGNLNLVKRFELFTTTIVLIQFEDKQEKEINVLKDLWKYSQDETLFKNMLRKELDQFLNDRHE